MAIAHVGALEARRWAGLVFAAGQDSGVGVRLAFVTPAGRRRDLDDWYWMVSRVGPHAPDGSYARMEFDLSVEPDSQSEPSASTLILEWSCRSDAVALRATVKSPGRVEVIGDAPWGWEARWVQVGAGAEPGSEGVSARGEAGGGSGSRAPAGPEGVAGWRGPKGTGAEADASRWRARVDGAEIAAAFSAGTEPCQAPSPGCGEVARGLEVEEGARKSVAMVAVWGGHAPATRAAHLVGSVDAWIDDARARWDRVRPRSPDSCPGLVESIADNLMWTVLLQPETGRLYTPAGRRWIFPKPRGTAGGPDRPAPVHRGPEPGPSEPDDWTVFGWDTFFNALQLAAVSGELAWSSLLAGTESRYPNGNIPNWRSRHRGTPDRSQPPVGSFAALKLHLIHPDLDALAAAYPALLAWSDWWVADKGGRPRREGLTPGLLVWGSDTRLVPGPGSVPPWEDGASGHQRAAWESGQDDLPLWDEAEWDPDHEILAMSAVDLCSYRALDLESLARIARILDDDRTARRLTAAYHHLTTTMNRVLWQEPAGLYLDELPSGPSTRVAASNFLPLIAGIPSQTRARRMIETLRDPSRFWGDWVLPTISRDDPAFADQQYWRGSIWPPMNYLVLQGLRRYGFRNLASALAWKGARMFLSDRRRTGMCRENFDSRTGRGRGQRFQSWAPLFALGALEELGATPAPPATPPPPRRPVPR